MEEQEQDSNDLQLAEDADIVASEENKAVEDQETLEEDQPEESSEAVNPQDDMEYDGVAEGNDTAQAHQNDDPEDINQDIDAREPEDMPQLDRYNTISSEDGNKPVGFPPETNVQLSQENDIPEPPQLPILEKIQPPKVALSALQPVWSFGINRHLPVINLSSENRDLIFYTCANLGILFDYEANNQRILQGHANDISCIYASVDRRWLVTADSGPQSSLVIWDSNTAGIVRIMHEPHSYGVVGVALTPDARYLATLSAPDPQNNLAQTFAVWDWTTGDEAPLCSAVLESSEYGIQSYIYFNPQNVQHVVTNSESQVLFFNWSPTSIEYYAPPLTDQDFNKPVGKFSQSIYQPNTTRALTATSQGLCVVWDTNKPLVKVSKEISADMKAVKLVPLHDRGINVLMLTEKFIVTADVAGHIKFFDYNLMLIYWYQHFNFGPVNSVGFRYYPRLAQKDDLGNAIYPTDATIPQDKFLIRDLVVGTSTAMILRMSPTDGEIHIIHREFDSTVDALACHPKLPRLAIGGYSGLLKIWNYKTMDVEVSHYFKKPTKITCCAFDSSGAYLAVGFSNGVLRLLDSLTLSEITPEPIHYSRKSVTHVAFSLNSEYLASVDAERTTTLLKVTPNQDLKSNGPPIIWTYMGRYRAHTDTVVDMKFGCNTDTGETQLITLGLDRRLVEYDIANSEKDHLKLLSVTKIEQSSNPLLICWYPPLGKERFLCTANDQYKLKLYNSTTKMCRQTFLGPTYGSQLKKLCVVPQLPEELETDHRFMAFVNDDKVGLIKLPLTGNPHNNVAFVAHPSGVSNLACSYDGRYVFTAGGKDSVVHMWLINREVLDAQSLLGGKGVDPFCELLEGGRNGQLYKELEDYFYYAQIRSQGINTMESRNVSTTIPLSEIPFVMRAMGFYPTEEEIEHMLNEVKLMEYVETGNYVNDVDIGQFVQLYVNHRPPFGISAEKIREAFQVLIKSSEHGHGAYLNRDSLLHLLQSTGEHMMDYELAEYLTTLMGFNPEGGSIEELDFDPATASEQIDANLPKKITANVFMSEILGLGPLQEDVAEGVSAPIRSPTFSFQDSYPTLSDRKSNSSSQTL